MRTIVMTDAELLESLRQYSKPGRGDDHPQAVACREAADRIEALTAERDRLREALRDGRRLLAIAQDDRIRLLIQLEQCEDHNE